MAQGFIANCERQATYLRPTNLHPTHGPVERLPKAFSCSSLGGRGIRVCLAELRANRSSPDRQRRFVAALAATGIVGKAARSIGKSTEALYRLKHLPGAEGFSAAWDAAVTRGLQRIDDCAIERALTGTRTPIVSGGEILGWWDKPDNALLRFLLTHRLPQLYGKQEAIGPGHPVYDELAAKAAQQVEAVQRATMRRAQALALAIHTHRRRKMWQFAREYGPDSRQARDVWHADGPEGYPEMPNLYGPDLQELAGHLLEDLERFRPSGAIRPAAGPR